MRRFVGLLFALFFAFPLGLSLVGCGHHAVTVYCNGEGYGPTIGQVKSITLASNLVATGQSLNYGQIGATLSASAVDCEDNPVSIAHYTYATTNASIADINPTSGVVCGGTWNRNSGGGVADYTLCTPPVNPTVHTAQITATANGATSNPIDIYIHPVVTGIVLGNASTSCPTDPNNTAGTDPSSSCAICNPNTTGSTASAPVYTGDQCLSQTVSGQLVARVYTNGTTDAADNISCQVGPLNFALQGTTDIATVNANGFITADQPGSALVTATVSNSSSAINAGFVSTCPPTSIVLTPVGGAATGSTATVALNTPQAFSVVATDKNNTVLTGLGLTFNSTLPLNFPTSSATVTPVYPGSSTITAVCEPPTCNTSPFSQIGYLGNGKPVTSNGIIVTAPGTASTVLYMGSTDSQYVVDEDFTTGILSAPIKLPYTPNSMVISQDGTTIYMGSAGGLITLSTGSNSASGANQLIQGNVLAVAPNNTYAVVTDPTRNTVSLVTPGGIVYSTFNGIGTRAQWSPDSATLYVTTTTNQLLTYSTFVGWQSTPINSGATGSSTTQDQLYNDVAVAVPYIGAYFAGPTTTDIRSYCATTSTGPGTAAPPAMSNLFTPLSSQANVATDRIAATTDGKHLLGATATTPASLVDLVPSFPASGNQPNGPGVCTDTGSGTLMTGTTLITNSFTTHPFTGITPGSITGVVPASNSGVAFVTYTLPAANGTGGLLPVYAPATGALNYVTLSGGAATAPVAGVFSTDNTTFYAGTSGDNIVHIITLTGNTGTDAGTITPALPGNTSPVATPNLIVQHPRRTTS